MRSLFVRIFLSYWIAQALFLVLAILVTMALRPTQELAAVQDLAPGFLSEAVQAYKNGGEEGAHHYLRGLRQTQHLRFFLFDSQGKELSGRKPPEWIDRVRRGETKTADSFWGRLGPGQFLRQSMTGPDGQNYTLVIEWPREDRAVFGPNGVPGLGILIAVISSGLVCYFLARYLTAPVVRLRAAAQGLAAGDLSARAGGASTRRHDEISELVRDFDAMAERLENLVNAQSRLLKDISHELRSPLARLNVALGLVRKRTAPEAQSTLDRIEREAERLNEMIGRLITLARLEGGAEAMSPVDVDLGELVAEIVADANFEAQSRHCRIACVIATNCVVRGDPSLLRSAIENVVRNGMRYTHEGTEVQVAVDCPAQQGRTEATVQVSDSGPGVPEDTLNKLFRPFYRTDDARVRETGGVGLGLAITERAVRLHGGTVRAANRPGGGLTVEIRLPAEPMPAQEAVAVEERSESK